MFKIGTYKPASAIEKIIQMSRGGGKPARRESPTGNWSEGAGGTTDSSRRRRRCREAFQHRGERPALLFKSAKSIAVC